MRQYLALFALACLLLCGCGLSDDRIAVTPHDPNSLWNLKLGRDYVSQGRYELAKEHYLMALASSNDAETRLLVTHELQAVDLMIKTQR